MPELDREEELARRADLMQEKKFRQQLKQRLQDRDEGDSVSKAAKRDCQRSSSRASH